MKKSILILISIVIGSCKVQHMTTPSTLTYTIEDEAITFVNDTLRDNSSINLHKMQSSNNLYQLAFKGKKIGHRIITKILIRSMDNTYHNSIIEKKKKNGAGSTTYYYRENISNSNLNYKKKTIIKRTFNLKEFGIITIKTVTKDSAGLKTKEIENLSDKKIEMN